MSEPAPAISGLQTPPLRSGLLGWAAIAQALVAAGLVAWIFGPAIDFMVFKWQTDGNWSHGWLVPFFSLYFLFIRRADLQPRRGLLNYLGLVPLVLGLALFYGGQISSFGYPQHVAIVPALLGLALLLYGWPVFKASWFPIAFLLCAIPLPQRLYFLVTLPLRRLASQASALVLGLLPGVDTEVQGTVIDYMYGGRASSLNVEEACSGMRLMMAFCTLGLAMAYLGDRPLWHRVLMVLACAPIAVICNAIRVCATGVLHVYGREDLAQGTAHELLGLAMLPIALGLFALLGYVLKNLFVEVPDEEEQAGVA